MFKVINRRGYYQIGANEYISVTTILKVISLGEGLVRWAANLGWEASQRQMKEKGELGSLVHKQIELYLKKQIKNFDLQSLEIKVRCELIRDWIESNNLEVIDSERIVWSDKYKYAGSLDVLCRIGKDYCIVDFKNTSGIWPTQFVQQAAYAKALREREDIKVKRLIIVRPVVGNETQDGTVEVQERRDVGKLFKSFLAAKTIYSFLHPRSALKIK